MKWMGLLLLLLRLSWNCRVVGGIPSKLPANLFVTNSQLLCFQTLGDSFPAISFPGLLWPSLWSCLGSWSSSDSFLGSSHHVGAFLRISVFGAWFHWLVTPPLFKAFSRPLANQIWFQSNLIPIWFQSNRSFQSRRLPSRLKCSGNTTLVLMFKPNQHRNESLWIMNYYLWWIAGTRAAIAGGTTTISKSLSTSFFFSLSLSFFFILFTSLPLNVDAVIDGYHCVDGVTTVPDLNIICFKFEVSPFDWLIIWNANADLT